MYRDMDVRVPRTQDACERPSAARPLEVPDGEIGMDAVSGPAAMLISMGRQVLPML